MQDDTTGAALPRHDAAAPEQKGQQQRRHDGENDRPEAPKPIRVEADHFPLPVFEAAKSR
jgi:hypothetical protein